MLRTDWRVHLGGRSRGSSLWNGEWTGGSLKLHSAVGVLSLTQSTLQSLGLNLEQSSEERHDVGQTLDSIDEESQSWVGTRIKDGLNHGRDLVTWWLGCLSGASCPVL